MNTNRDFKRLKRINYINYYIFTFLLIFKYFRLILVNAVVMGCKSHLEMLPPSQGGVVQDPPWVVGIEAAARGDRVSRF